MERFLDWWGGLMTAIALGLFGSLIRMGQLWSGGKLNRTDLLNAAIDLGGSAFISVVAYMLTLWALTVWLGPNQLHAMAAAAMGGMAGHVGTRWLVRFIKDYARKKLK